MRDPWAQMAVYLFAWAQKGQSPNGRLKDETSKYHQAMSVLWAMKGECESKILEEVRSKGK